LPVTSTFLGVNPRGDLKLTPIDAVDRVHSIASQRQPPAQRPYRDRPTVVFDHCLPIELVTSPAWQACDNEQLASNLPENNPICAGFFSYFCHVVDLWTAISSTLILLSDRMPSLCG
jgi:hypothetical protein